MTETANDGTTGLAKPKLKLKPNREKTKMNNNDNTGVATIPQPNNAAVKMADVIERFEVYRKAGECLAATGIFGDISPSQGTVAAMTMASEGLTPIQFKARWHMAKNGMLTRVTNSILGDFQMDGGTWNIVRSDREVCEIVFKYRDGEPFRSKVEMSEMLLTKHPYAGKPTAYPAPDGKRYLKDNWAESAEDMLFHRCCGKGLRRVWPKGMGGIYLHGEIEEDEIAHRHLVPVRAKVSDSPIADAPKAQLAEPEVVDFEVCPCGKAKGKRFDELPNETLTAILATADKFPAITEGHKAAVANVLAEREEAENKGN